MAYSLYLLLALSLFHSTFAYIPAQPTNDSSALTQSDDLLHLAYYNGPFSVFTADVARQLLAEGFGDDGNYTNTTTIVPWTRYSKGVLLHFDETLRNQPPAAVPWLAMINCDTNGTSFSDVDDIFTICRDLGAQAAVLYSLTAQGCLINEEYLTYEKVLDVYATTSLQNARIIENQFGNVNSSAWKYDSEALNASATLIDALLANNALSVIGNIPINETNTNEDTPDSTPTETSSSSTTEETNNPATLLFSDTTSASSPTPTGLRLVKRQATSPTTATQRPSSSSSSRPSSSSPTKTTPVPTVAINYLGAVVAARNLTVGGLNAGASPSPSSGSGRKNDGGPNTGLAMIILYSITGVVTFLFFAVILTGAVRAIRYPERYGPRAGFGYRANGGGGGPNGEGGSGGNGAQNRAQGLARAVLDTFPIVRFGGGGAGERDRRDEEEGEGDGDSQKESERSRTRAGKEEMRDGEDIELVRLAPVLSAVPKQIGERDEIEEVETRGNVGGEVREIGSARSTASISSNVPTLSPPVPTTRIGETDPALGILSVVGPSTTSNDNPFDSSRNLDTSLDAPSATSSNGFSSPISPPPVSTANTVSQEAEDEDQLSCPICVCEFTPGDSIRILPCDARHQFHVECIDPWLLGVSRLCPLCRLDLGENRSTETGAGTEEVVVGDGDARERERERERHEEERVVRHLRGLLNRGSSSTSATNSSTSPGSSSTNTTTTTTLIDSVGRRRTRSNSTAGQAQGDAGGERDTVGLRSRFAKYVAVRRRRRDNTPVVSGSTPPPTD